MPDPVAGALRRGEHVLKLLGGPDRGHPGAAGRRLSSQIRPHPIDLAVILAEPHHRDVVGFTERCHHRLVPELDRFAQAALGDRTRIGIVQADPPGRAIGGVAVHPLAGLRDDLARRGQQFGQVVDRAHQPAPAPPRRRIVLTAGRQVGGLGLRAAHRLPGVGQQPLAFTGGGLGQTGQLTSPLEHRGLRLVRADRRTGPQLGRDRARPLPGRAGAVPHRDARRSAGGLNPLAGRGDPANRLGQQPRIGRGDTLAGTTVVSARTRLVRSSFASAALASSASLSPSTVTDPHLVVSFINVVGCGTDPPNPIRQNRRQVIESASSRHSDSYPSR